VPYGLNMKCHLQAHVLSVWSPAGGITLGGTGNLRKLGLAEESRSLEVDPGGYILPLPLHAPATMMFYPSAWGQKTMD
jgi:hypothetical protein